MPPSVGCSPPEAFRFAPSLPLRFACGPLPLTCPRVGTGPGGDSRPHLRHCKKAILLIIRGIAIVFVIENYYLLFGRQMEKLLVALAHNLRKHIAVERMRSNAASCCRCGAPLIKKEEADPF